jgi:hypothetical protein
MLILVTFLLSPELYAQLKVSAELRNRGEANHGYRDIPIESSQTAYFMSQRTRLNLAFRKDKFNTYISVQDVRLWGQEDLASKTGVQVSSMGLDVSQAWLDWNFAQNWGLKMGRQIWSYDDGRILATRNWNQTALSWDALLLHLDKDDFHFHFGSSFNNTFILFDPSKFVMEDNPYEDPYQYRIRYFNFIWAKFQASKTFNISFSEYLASYLGKNTTSTFYNLSTTGIHLDFHAEKLKIIANAYYQYGKKTAGENGNAYMTTISGTYKLHKFTLGLGYDYLSGYKYSESSTGNNSRAFDLMYGGRHKFYGWMNYYLLTKDTKEGGLVDLYPSAKWTINKKHSLYMIYHMHWLAQQVGADYVGGDYSYLNKTLGGELNINYTYKYDKSFNIQMFAGYYFATETAEFVKGISRAQSTSPYWVSLMLTYKPVLFKN